MPKPWRHVHRAANARGVAQDRRGPVEALVQGKNQLTYPRPARGTSCKHKQLLNGFIGQGRKMQNAIGYIRVSTAGKVVNDVSLEVKASFEARIASHLEMLGHWLADAGVENSNDRSMAVLSTMVAAVVLSRAVNDKQLSAKLLHAAAESVLEDLPANGRSQQ